MYKICCFYRRRKVKPSRRKMFMIKTGRKHVKIVEKKCNTITSKQHVTYFFSPFGPSLVLRFNVLGISFEYIKPKTNKRKYLNTAN